MPGTRKPSLSAVRLIASASAVISVAFTLIAGQRNPSRLLIFLFVLWVLAPFMAILALERTGNARDAHSRKALSWLALGISLATPFLYGRVALRTPEEAAHRQAAAAVFVIAPPCCLLLVGVVLAVAERRHRRRLSAYLV